VLLDTAPVQLAILFCVPFVTSEDLGLFPVVAAREVNGTSFASFSGLLAFLTCR
jgi:hypothetical protein